MRAPSAAIKHSSFCFIKIKDEFVILCQLNYSNMKILKNVLLVLAILVAIPLIVAIFTKKDYAIEREVTISKPKQDVFNYVKLLRNQVNYSKWAKMDPNAVMEYRGTDGTPGFEATWDSKVKDVGKGEQKITNVTEGSRIDLDLHFIKPMEGKAHAYMTTDAISDNQTKVKWGMTGKMNYPFNFLMLVMNMDKMLGAELQIGLDNLKGILEKQ
jgi:hypothetical protein